MLYEVITRDYRVARPRSHDACLVVGMRIRFATCNETRAEANAIGTVVERSLNIGAGRNAAGRHEQRIGMAPTSLRHQIQYPRIRPDVTRNNFV